MEPDSGQPLNNHDVPPFRKPRSPLETFKKVGIPIIAVILSLIALGIVALLIKVVLDKYYFICGNPLTFIPRGQMCDGHLDCASGEDEEHCVKNFPEKPGVTVRLSKDRSTLQVLDAARGTWASVCFDNFTEALAKTACRQMGYNSQPAFGPVEMGPNQTLLVTPVTGNSQELQMQNGSR